MARPRGISPGARARRALLFDTLAALVLAAVSLSLAAGLGVVAFFGLPVLVLGLLWIVAERLVRRVRAPRGATSTVRAGPRRAPASGGLDSVNPP
jgi:hypothetical protein